MEEHQTGDFMYDLQVLTGIRFINQHTRHGVTDYSGKDKVLWELISAR